MIHTSFNKHTEAYTQHGLYPNMFVSEKEKRDPDYIASLMDYFSSNAISGVRHNTKTFCKNYRFVKGELTPEDFYDKSVVQDFIMDAVDAENPLPDHIQQYSILSQPINSMLGELTERPDNIYVKAFDDDSRSEENLFKTTLLNNYILQKAAERIQLQAAEQGVDLSTDEGQQYLQQYTEEQVGDLLTSYTSQAEKWGARMLEALKMEFNMKELSEEAFRDLLITGRQRYHIYEDNSKLGFKVECLNPRNVVIHTSPNKKYTRDAHAVSIVEVMTISEILERFDLTKKEVDHLIDQQEKDYLVKGQESNLFSGRTGVESIHYNTYDPLLLEERLKNESMLMEDTFDWDLSSVSNMGILGQRFVVTQTYWLSKIKIGELVYIDEDGIEQTVLVDENYKNKEHPQQVSLTWGYENQWWKGYKIGSEIYDAEPFELLPYCPVIGVDHENRNTTVKSLVDLMKPYQMIFNVCMNQLWELLEKEIGVTYEFNWRQIPVNKDSDYQDALDEWLTQAKELGFTFKDDSIENTKVATSNTSVARAVDLGRAQEMQSRLTIAMQIKQECHELVGVNRQRLGGVLATETATGTRQALSASYSQTEPWFATHEYTLNQLYQGVLDAAQYIESQKEVSTISNISNEGEHAFVQITGPELKLKDLRVYVTSRSKDLRVFQQLQALAQPMLQNGADFSTVAKMFDTTSLRELHDTFKREKIKREQQQQQQMQLQQQQIQAQQQTAMAQLQADQQNKAEERAFEANENRLDRLSRERIAALNAAGRDSSILGDSDGDGTADALQVTQMTQEIVNSNRQYELEQSRIQSEIASQQDKIANDKSKTAREQEKYQEEVKLKKEQLRIQEKKIDTDLKIAKENKNRHDSA